MLEDIGKKSVSVESIAKKVVKDRKLLNDLLDNAASDKAVIKYKSLKVLTLLSEQQSELLYPKWDFFVKSSFYILIVPNPDKPEPRNVCHQGTQRILFCYSFLVSWCGEKK